MKANYFDFIAPTIKQSLIFFLTGLAPILGNSIPTHLLPLSKDCQLIENEFYSICYHSKYRNSAWTIHELDRAQLLGREARTNDYRSDPRTQNPVNENDYRYSGFDRGHLVPAADMKRDRLSMSQTFYMSNMAPQRPEFNRGIWSVLEKRIRKDFLATGENRDTFIYTGSILSSQLPTLASQVTIPEWFYKIIYNQRNQTVRAYLIDNQRYSSSELESFRVTVDYIEEISGLDFFIHLPLSVQDELESRI